MKRILTAIALAALFSTPSVADEKGIYREIKGTLTKIDGNYYVVTDSGGREHRYAFDASTKKEGDIKEGAKVEIYVDKDHVAKIEEK